MKKEKERNYIKILGIPKTINEENFIMILKDLKCNNFSDVQNPKIRMLLDSNEETKLFAYVNFKEEIDCKNAISLLINKILYFDKKKFIFKYENIDKNLLRLEIIDGQERLKDINVNLANKDVKINKYGGYHLRV